MINNSRQERLKLILGTVCALFLIGFVLVFGVMTRQSYTEKERNGTLKTISQEHTVTLVESGRTSWRYWDHGENPDPSASLRWTEPDYDDTAWKSGTGDFGSHYGQLEKWSTGKRRAIC